MFIEASLGAGTAFGALIMWTRGRQKGLLEK
jgi:hypothetical protein